MAAADDLSRIDGSLTQFDGLETHLGNRDLFRPPAPISANLSLNLLEAFFEDRRVTLASGGNVDAIFEQREVFAAVDIGHKVRLDGICSVNGGPDIACSAVRMSLVAMTVRTEADVVVGDAVTLQLPQIGIVEALVSEVVFGGFDLSFEPAPKSKLGTYVIWLAGTDVGDDDREHDGRQHERLVPIKRLTTLKREGVPPSMARIADLSRSGAAFTYGKPLDIGERVELGARRGSIVRLMEGGAAVRFDRLIDEQDFGILIDLDAVGA